MNKATKLFVNTLGTIFGISGMSHGIFEILQGNIPTQGNFISAIGEAQKMWPHGNEYALTIINNFLITGIIALCAGIILVIWSLIFVHKMFGSSILLSLFVVLFFVGGGVAQIIFFPIIIYVSTQINKPLSWWKRIINEKILRSLSRLWPWLLGICAFLMIFVLEIAITGFVPGVSNSETVLSIMLLCLLIELIMLPITIISSFARDVVDKDL